MIVVFALSLAFGFVFVIVPRALLWIGDFLNDCGRDSLIIALQEMADCSEVQRLLRGEWPGDLRFNVLPPPIVAPEFIADRVITEQFPGTIPGDIIQVTYRGRRVPLGGLLDGAYPDASGRIRT
jgi:hypothetical protein